ncbi:hypothetical protein N8J89_17365 [Crossiella sp. CA-258035]|uniref:hypothetical protein n=1 Tax=Crossiella sp. CA-258035 TaxID=2981138 RepID=UPI0024BD54CF|nr:hypothetical protein [Crossiella sp. CA-258035]WHT22764.1 hypothetical protein N8J89_17365 [Crossiella sp. CA-258035]
MQPDRFVPPGERLALDLARALRTPGHPPLTVLSGPSGADLDAVADHLHRHCANDFAHVRVVDLSFACSASGTTLLELIPATALLRGAAGTLLLLKDLHRLPPAGLGSLEALIRQLAGTGSACVGTVALPLCGQSVPALLAGAARLSRDGLLHQVILRPLPRTALPTLVTSLLGGAPEPALVDLLWQITRGWPAAVGAALAIGRDSGLLRVVDRHAYLSPWPGRPELSEQHEVLVAIRRLGPAAWAAAKAVAVLWPLGPAAARLVGEALGVPEPAAQGQLRLLAEAGVLRRRRGGAGWTFRLPLVAGALTWALGPYERRRLAQLAVLALWSGQASCELPGYLPDQLVQAGRLVDPERALADLLAAAGTVPGDQAIPWLRAATELTADRAGRLELLLRHAHTCLAHGQPTGALESVETVLRAHAEELSHGRLLAVCFLRLTALHRAGDQDALTETAEGRSAPGARTPLHAKLLRAFALTLLGRWLVTRELLREIRADPAADEEVAQQVRSFSSLVHLWLGDRSEFDQEVAALPRRVAAGERPVPELLAHTGALLVLGEPHRAERLLTETNLPVQLALPSRMLRAVGDGRFPEALELARKEIATSAPNGCDPGQTAMCQLAATIQLLGGRLFRGRELIAAARARGPALPHLLALPEALYEWAFGETGRVRSILLAAVRQAEQEGVLAHVDEVWLALADLDVSIDDPGCLPTYLAKVEQVAARLGTERAELNRLTLHALVHEDQHAARAALDLLRTRAQPLEQAIVLERLVRYGIGAPALLAESYQRYGELDALMSRSWLRTLMRRHGVAVPGRQATLAENERLLAVLVAEGLGNRQLATLLQTSEKSVEGRLSRMFQRSGYRSRVDLATAILTGQFGGA